MADNIRDVEVPIGFTGEVKRLGDLTDNDVGRIMLSYDDLIGEGLADEGYPCSEVIYNTAQSPLWSEAEVKAYVNTMSELAGELAALRTKRRWIADDRAQVLPYDARAVRGMPDPIRSLYRDLIGPALDKAEDGMPVAEIGDWYRAQLEKAMDEPDAIRAFAATTLASLYDRTRETRENGAGVPYMADVGDFITVAGVDPSNRERVDYGIVVDRFPPEVALAYVFESHESEQLKAARQYRIRNFANYNEEEVSRIAHWIGKHMAKKGDSVESMTGLPLR